MNKQKIYQYIDENSCLYTDISHKVWEYAELSLKEYKSAALYKAELEKAGFVLKDKLGGIETAFSGSYTMGPPPGAEGAGPVIGILGEFDALSGLSQQAGAIECMEPEDADLAAEQAGSGHGCGHNMLGAASFGAACAVKRFLEETKTPGTVVFYGCPGEEGGASKAFLAREGEWKKLDAAITWHPGSMNEVTTGTSNSCTQVLYKFKGLAAHAAGNPFDGRSALDAVELMNIGCNYLREHMKKECSIHYAMIDGGGFSPNVVQPHASVLYMVRAIKVKDVKELQARVDKLAEGAALMTGTSCERIFVDGTANPLPNTALEKVIFRNLQEVPLPVYSAEEKEYAAKLRKTWERRESFPGLGALADKNIAAEVKELTKNGTLDLNSFVYPFYSGEEFTPGSTDVGDVSWLTPTVQFNAVTWPAGSPGHSWQNVSCGRTSIGDKGLLYAAKVLAGTAADLFTETGLLKEAEAEFEERTKDEKYLCPIEEDAVPYVIG